MVFDAENLRKPYVFKGFMKIAKISSDYSWEVLTLAKKSVDFTSVLEGHSLKPMYCRTKKRQFLKPM